MPKNTYDARIGVVGFGPRGLGALEALAAQSIDAQKTISIDLFDASDALAAGPNFHPDESDICLLNIPIRVLDIDPPGFLSDHIAPFAQWSETTYTPDDFPPRCDLGAYLAARFAAMCDATEGVFNISHVDAHAAAIEQDASGWWIVSDGARHGPYDEVLLSPGQPATKPDPQLDRWTKHAEDHALDLLPAYPATTLLKAAEGWSEKVVAVRGLGLSTHDVLRILTTGMSGRFEGGKYVRSGAEPHKILPFSRDGLPPTPKPATAKIDAMYDLNDAETRAFAAALEEAVTQAPDDALRTVCDALIAPAERVIAALNGAQSQGEVARWLKVERSDPGTQDIQDPLAALRTMIDMAHGRMPPTVGYAIGQIWRKLQNALRRGVNGANLAPDTAIALIGFDEGLKRISYGPPVTASEQLCTLVEDGLVSLCTVDDPSILLDPKGWRLVEGDDALLAPVMIDAVLPGPDLTNIIDPLIAGAIDGGLITPVDDGFGAKTRPDGSLLNRDGHAIAGLCMLGRLSLGSVIATDSLHDCFGASTHRWAAGVLSRMA